jgi:hypothetical protein
MGLSRHLSLILGGAAQWYAPLLTPSFSINLTKPSTYLAGSAIPILLMDRFGRRTLLLLCTAGLCLCFTMVSIFVSLNTTHGTYGATAFIFVFQLIYGVGWLPVPWFYPSEISTTRTRTSMQAIASTFNWMFVFVVVKITPLAFDNIGWKTFIIFSVLNAAFIPMVYCFYPETKGISLEDIPLLFEKGGVMGGVLTSVGGGTVVPGQHAQEGHVEETIPARHLDEEAARGGEVV